MPGQFVTARGTVFDDGRQGIEQAAVLCGGANLHQFEQAEQKAAGFGVDRPQQGQIIVAMPCADRFALLGERVDTALLGKKGTDAMSRVGVALAVLCGFQHLPQDCDQPLLHFPVLILERLEFFLGRRLGLADAAHQHFDQFVTTLRADLPQQAQYQGVAFSRPGNGEKLAHLQGPGFGGELTQLGVGDAHQQWIWINQPGQPIETFGPKLDRFGTGRPPASA